MPPRKKLKRDKCTSKEEKKGTLQNSSESAHLVAENSSGGENLYFSLLPNEVLLSIFKYLSPADLLSIAELGDPRLKQLIFLTKEYNFSSCRKANLDVKFFFYRCHITNNIRKLNFNNEMYLKPHEIVQFIYKCKNLTHLSIVNCGIKYYHHLWDILLRCTKLQVLAWDVSQDYFLKSCQDGLHPSLKTVYLFGDFAKQKSFSSSIRSSVSYSHNIFVNFSVDSFLALPFLGNWSRAYCISFLNNVNHAYTYNSFQSCMEEFNSQKVAYHIEEKDTRWHPSVYNSPPFIQIRTLESDISILQFYASNTITSVNLILHPKIIDLWLSLVEALTKVGEQSLKYVSIDSTGTNEYDDEAISGPISAEESLAVCDMFDKLCMTFKNITVLNIATVHFNSCSPFITGYKLECVRTLSISSCAFKSFKLSGFDKVVSRCPKVRSFSLYCCPDDQNKLSEKDMIVMRAWKELQHLTLYSLIFKNCSFLKKVADSCKKFTSLSIITVHPNSVCLFMTDLIYMLRVAKNLSFIRINVKNFNPMYEGFWNAIGEAKNLEGICLITESSTYVTMHTILKGIKKLKHLHLFHLYAQKTPENLYARVKKSMQEQGIKNVKIESDCNISHRECKRPYYHQQPRFCCNRIHLNEVNLI